MHIYREQNQVADTLAKEGLRQGNMEHDHFLEVLPMSTHTRIQAGIVETTFVRKTHVKTTPITTLLPLGQDVTQSISNVQIIVSSNGADSMN